MTSIALSMQNAASTTAEVAATTTAEPVWTTATMDLASWMTTTPMPMPAETTFPAERRRLQGNVWRGREVATAYIFNSSKESSSQLAQCKTTGSEAVPPPCNSSQGQFVFWLRDLVAGQTYDAYCTDG